MGLHSYPYSRPKPNACIFLIIAVLSTYILPTSVAIFHISSVDMNVPPGRPRDRLSIKDFTTTLRGGSSRDYVYTEEDSGSNRYRDGRPMNNYYEDSRYDTFSRDDPDREDNRDDSYYQEDYEYRRREVERKPEKRDYQSSPSLPNIPELLNFGNKKVGMVFLAGGVVFTMLGISLFFNKSLMRLGNLLFIAGVPLTIGPGRTAGYFLQPRKARATGCLGLGVFLVMVGWPIFGIALEIFGLLNLFGNMFPILMVLIKQLPGVGSVMGDGSGRRNTRNRRENDYYESERDRGRYREDRYEYGGDERDDNNEDDYRMERDRYN